MGFQRKSNAKPRRQYHMPAADSPRRKRLDLFVAHWRVDPSPRRAAIAAGYKAEYAAQQGYDLLRRDPYVKERIEKTMGEEPRLLALTKEEILDRIYKILENVEAKDSDKVAAAKLALQACGYLVHKVQVDDASGFAEALKAARERAAKP